MRKDDPNVHVFQNKNERAEENLLIRFWATSVFVLKYVHIWVIFLQNLLKQLSLIDDAV